MHRHDKRIKQTTLLAMSQYKNGGRGGGVGGRWGAPGIHGCTSKQLSNTYGCCQPASREPPRLI